MTGSCISVPAAICTGIELLMSVSFLALPLGYLLPYNLGGPERSKLYAKERVIPDDGELGERRGGT